MPAKKSTRRIAKPAPDSGDAASPESADADTDTDTDAHADAADGFPIVGIGASAGGLAAVEEFLSGVPEDSGMAFVIVQHLDPTRKALMVELLQRSTPLKVLEIRDGMRVRPGHIYVIAPNRDLSILHGVLHLLTPVQPRGQRLPIDFFLTSLARDRPDRAIGVILSGMGSDGTEGLRAIRENAGLTLAQEPASAEFDSMPRSAADAGLVDIAGPARDLPGKLIQALQQPAPAARADAAPPAANARDLLDKVILLLRDHSGNDFSLYKRPTLLRRIERRMGLHGIPEVPVYVRFLQENPQELGLLFKELLIGVTGFFRDAAAWKQLESEVIPALLANRPPDHPLRAWVPGCSTGEEAYSLAIILKEAAEAAGPHAKFTIQIFATDLDRDAIDKARAGFYSAAISKDLSPARLKRFFTAADGGYRIRKEIREMIIFAPHNVIMDPPFTRLDLLSCRNLLIYLTPAVQKKLIPLFHYSLAADGILFQGSAETIGETTDLFSPLEGKGRFFQRRESILRSPPVAFPPAFSRNSPANSEPSSNAAPPASLQTLAEQLVLKKYAPPAVLTNDRGDILYVSGSTGAFLEPAAGKANWNLFAMAREGLRYEIADGFRLALRSKEAVTLSGLTPIGPGPELSVNATLQRLDTPGPLQGLVMIVFIPVPRADRQPTDPPARAPRAGSVRLAELEKELLRFRGEARANHEVMQTSQEELRSANEELQSTNEEMQSTNEELTTSKEEMQSMNEELQAVNAELQCKVDELSRTSNDMKNLLDSTDIATLFLDNELHVRRFTPQATKIIRLIPGDTGRPITDLVSNLRQNTLAEDAREVLRDLVPLEKTVEAADDRWFTVRIMPYRTVDDRVDGVVITFANITVAKTLEARLRKNQSCPPTGPPPLTKVRHRKTPPPASSLPPAS